MRLLERKILVKILFHDPFWVFKMLFLASACNSSGSCLFFLWWHKNRNILIRNFGFYYAEVQTEYNWLFYSQKCYGILILGFGPIVHYHQLEFILTTWPFAFEYLVELSVCWIPCPMQKFSNTIDVKQVPQSVMIRSGKSHRCI